MGSSSRTQRKLPLVPLVKSPLVKSMISGERENIGSVLVNDQNGLSLLDTTAVDGKQSNNKISGMYTSLTRLSSALTPCSKNQPNDTSSPPLITIEMEGLSSVLIKEYEGHAVAIKVPNGRT